MPQPNKIPKAFAVSGDRNIIPESTGTLGLASWNEGFPAITSVPFSEGGIAPKRADFNGIFNALSLATLWQQQGGFYAYDATTDYEVGNVVLYSGDLYKCLSANGPTSAVKTPTDMTAWGKLPTIGDVNSIISSYLPGNVSATVFGNVTAPPNTVVSLGEITLQPGNYILIATCSFPEFSQGYGQLGITLSATSSNMDRYSLVRARLVDSYGLVLQLTRVMSVTATTAYYINAKHSAESTLTLSGGGALYKRLL